MLSICLSQQVSPGGSSGEMEVEREHCKNVSFADALPEKKALAPH